MKESDFLKAGIMAVGVALAALNHSPEEKKPTPVHQEDNSRSLDSDTWSFLLQSYDKRAVFHYLTKEPISYAEALVIAKDGLTKDVRLMGIHKGHYDVRQMQFLLDIDPIKEYQLISTAVH